MKKLLSLLSLSFMLVACNESYSVKSGAQFGGGTITCPTGYARISFNNDVGTVKDFCVAKYEMRNVSGVATSQAVQTPWTSVSPTDAMTACQALGPGYDLIANNEWMTIARNIESVSSNFVSGYLNAGISYMCDSTAEITDHTCVALSLSHDFKRTHTLSNGEIIWDFSGNAREWVDWTIETPSNTFTPAPVNSVCSGGAYQEPQQAISSCTSVVTNSTVAPNDVTLDSSRGSGQIHLGWGASGGSGAGAGYVSRSGGGTGGFGPGVYMANFGWDGSYYNSFDGFRCVYRGQ